MTSVFVPWAQLLLTRLDQLLWPLNRSRLVRHTHARTITWCQNWQIIDKNPWSLDDSLCFCAPNSCYQDQTCFARWSENLGILPIINSPSPAIESCWGLLIVPLSFLTDHRPTGLVMFSWQFRDRYLPPAVLHQCILQIICYGRQFTNLA